MVGVADFGEELADELPLVELGGVELVDFVEDEAAVVTAAGGGTTPVLVPHI